MADTDPVKLLILGAGARGEEYSRYSLHYPGQVEISGVAEPREEYRKQFAGKYNVPSRNVFKTWQQALCREKMADAVVITTQDRIHYAPAAAALEQGYHVLVEKPMATAREECISMVELSRRYRRILGVCHVLRYTPFFMKLKQLAAPARIGRIVTIHLLEPVGYWHMAHSFVRGNWSRQAESSPMILAKSCHDLDIIRWFADAGCRKAASFGSLLHFRPQNAPPGSTQRCTDGCAAEAACPYSALKIYLDTDNRGWPVDIISRDLSRAGREKALREGPYGRCVYKCNNDVVDHQVVILEFNNGITASFTMSGFTRDVGSRKIRIMGTLGELAGDFRFIEWNDFRTGGSEVFDTAEEFPAGMGAHGGGDFGLVRDFIAAVKRGIPLPSSAEVSLESHLMAFAAEESRLGGKIVNLQPGFAG